MVDIAAEALKVGNALTSVRIDKMLVNLAAGIAQGQYHLDRTSIDITKLMGDPQASPVYIGGEKLSMLEAGFIPTFYHFVDSIIELKMEVNIREEEFKERKVSETTSAEVTVTGSGNWGFASVEVSATAAYSKTVDATHSQKFSQDLSATSLMRAKLVPKPAPDLFVERIRKLIEEVREEHTDEDGNVDFGKMVDDFRKSIIEEAVSDVTSGIG
jgi:hypothetical protein